MAHTQAIVTPFFGRLAKPYGPAGLSSGSGVAIAHLTSPRISTYPWTNGIGFGTKFANPATLPTGTGNGVAFTPNADTIFVAHDTSPFVSAYPWSTSGFGTKYANPGTLPGNNQTDVAMRSLVSSSNHHVGLSQETTSPFQNIYAFSKTGAGWGSRFANPATLPVGSGLSIDFAGDGLSIVIGHLTTPFLSAYPWSDAGYGTKYANPAALPFAGGTDVRFNPALGAVATAHGNGGAGGPMVTAWAFTTGVGFGAKYADPVYPVGVPGAINFSGQACGFTRAGDAIMTGTGLSAVFGGMFGWQWDNGGGFGSLYTLNFPFLASVHDVAWNETGTTLFAGYANNAPNLSFMFAKPWTNALGMGTSYADPATLPTGTGEGAAVAA